MDYKKYIKYKSKYITLKNSLNGGSEKTIVSPDKLLSLQTNFYRLLHKDGYYLIEEQYSSVIDYLLGANKLILIIGAHPLERDKFIIPTDTLPVFIDTLDHLSPETYRNIIRNYNENITTFENFPLFIGSIYVINNILEILGIKEHVKFDYIIFDDGVCFHLDLNVRNINFIINLLKKNKTSMLVFDNRRNNVAVGRSSSKEISFIEDNFPFYYKDSNSQEILKTVFRYITSFFPNIYVSPTITTCEGETNDMIQYYLKEGCIGSLDPSNIKELFLFTCETNFFLSSKFPLNMYFYIMYSNEES
jgi:hypothetical protein